ncbi:MAG: PilN domain-containing protein [Methylovirgula sp.]
MQLGAILLRWIEVLAALITDWRVLWQARRSIIVTREDARFLVRRPGTAADTLLANVATGTRVPSETAQALRNHFVVFELAPDNVVTRHLAVPVQAREFMPGIVGNQIERLSPWPLAHAIYGFDATPSQDDAGILDVRVLIASRANIETICDELTASGLSPNRISVRTHAGVDASLVTLWTRPTHVPQRNFQSLPRMIGAGLAAVVLLSTALSLWSIYSANSIWAEHEEVAALTNALRQHDRMSRKPQELASLAPAERAWVLKENSPVAVLILDALTRAIPDSAYLTELRLENVDLRITGLAADAPSLIPALEQSHRFSEVHFFAPTIKSQDGGLYRFSIAARVAPRRELIGD